MRREAVARDLSAVSEPETSPQQRFGGGSPPFSETPGVPVQNGRFGLMIFLAAESMFFAGLVSAFLVLRLGSVTWPPPLQPRLPVEATAGNTVVLLLSGLTMHIAVRAARREDRRNFVRLFLLTALLGVLFLTAQGLEWVRLVHFGLTAQVSTYGATFYTLIGFHGAHVLGAVVWLTVLLATTLAGRPSPVAGERVEICAMYWYFVVLLWPVLYVLVYLG